MTSKELEHDNDNLNHATDKIKKYDIDYDATMSRFLL